MIGQVLSYIHSDGKWIPCVVLWALWRTWMFSIKPRLPVFRDGVDVLPYNIPFIGHAISLFRDPLTLYEYAHTFFGKTRKPYAIHTAGQITLVITNSEQAAEILNNGDSYTSDPFLDALYRTVGGVSTTGSHKLWKKGTQNSNANHKRTTLVQKCQDILFRELSSPIPAGLDINTKAISLVEAATRNGVPSSAEISHTEDNTKVVSLHRWCRDILIKAQMDLFFGPSLVEEIEPDAVSLFDSFDASSWMLAYQYPSFLAKQATMTRESLVRALQTYLDAVAVKKDNNENNPVFAPVIEEMKGAGLSHEDCARVLLVMFWEINATVQTTAFWMLAHLLRPENKSLIDTIRTETTPVITGMTSQLVPRTSMEFQPLDEPSVFDYNALNSSTCPTLHSLYAEVMRVFNTSAPIRVTTRPVLLSSGTRTQSNSETKVIPTNTKIVLPQRMIALSPELFGPKADHVDPHRFATPSNKEHGAHAPESLALGTFLAQNSAKTVGKSAVLGFVALVLWRFDLEVVLEGQMAKDDRTVGMGVPRIALKTPSLGVSRHVDGDDVIVEVRNRQ
ncbi:Cytochrome P450 [Rhypophila sp. PSN 637]